MPNDYSDPFGPIYVPPVPSTPAPSVPPMPEPVAAPMIAPMPEPVPAPMISSLPEPASVSVPPMVMPTAPNNPYGSASPTSVPYVTPAPVQSGGAPQVYLNTSAPVPMLVQGPTGVPVEMNSYLAADPIIDVQQYLSTQPGNVAGTLVYDAASIDALRASLQQGLVPAPKSVVPVGVVPEGGGGAVQYSPLVPAAKPQTATAIDLTTAGIKSTGAFGPSQTTPGAVEYKLTQVISKDVLASGEDAAALDANAIAKQRGVDLSKYDVSVSADAFSVPDAGGMQARGITLVATPKAPDLSASQVLLSDPTYARISGLAGSPTTTPEQLANSMITFSSPQKDANGIPDYAGQWSDQAKELRRVDGLVTEQAKVKGLDPVTAAQLNMQSVALQKAAVYADGQAKAIGESASIKTIEAVKTGGVAAAAELGISAAMMAAAPEQTQMILDQVAEAGTSDPAAAATAVRYARQQVAGLDASLKQKDPTKSNWFVDKDGYGNTISYNAQGILVTASVGLSLYEALYARPQEAEKQREYQLMLMDKQLEQQKELNQQMIDANMEIAQLEASTALEVADKNTSKGTPSSVNPGVSL